MMSESVTVNVQDGGRTGGGGGPGKSDQGPVLTGISLKLPYFRTIPGLIKITQLVLGIICMACGSPAWRAGHWFLFVVVTAFIMTLIWSLIYLFSVRNALKIPINWILTELINTGIYTVLYFTAFITKLAWAFTAPYIIAGVFGILATLAHAAGTYFLYLEDKNGQQQ